MKLSLAKKWLSLTYMGTLPFLTRVWGGACQKQAAAFNENLGTRTQRPPFTGSTPVELGTCVGVSLLRVRDSYKSEGLKSQVLVMISIRQQITCIQKLIFFWFCLFFNLFPWRKGQILLNSTYQTKCSFPYHCPVVKSGYSFTHQILYFCCIYFDRLCNVICL